MMSELGENEYREDDIEYSQDLIALFNGMPVTGTVVAFDSHGRKESSDEYRRGIRHGVSREYYPNGNVSEEHHYRMGVHEGPIIEYYENGRMKSEEIRHLGEVSSHRSWSPDGTELHSEADK
jgi:antitoxin component YwqK of YwqJK toxin-antitoxin module